MSLHLILVTIFAGGGRSERSKGVDGAAAAGEILTAFVFCFRVGGDSESHATAAAKAGRPLPASAGEDRRPSN
jgi:hypothetical protein